MSENSEVASACRDTHLEREKMRAHYGALLLISGLLVACGSSDDDTTGQETNIDLIPPPPVDPGTGLSQCTAASPVGEPCLDEFGATICRVDTGYPGDDFALCAPDPNEGMIMHYGPSTYDDPAELEHYLIPPGVEDENCMFAHTPNAEDRFVTNYRGRMRPNSHHLIVTTIETDVVDSEVPGPCNLGDAVGTRWLVGSQDPQIDVAIGGLGLTDGDVPQEGDPDYGLAQEILARTPVRLDMHYVNTTDETLLREAWISFDYVEERDVVNLVDMITFFQGEIAVPPQSSFTTARGLCTAPTDRYVGLLTGHAHEKMTRVSVWHHDTAGSERLVYETYDWAEPGNLFYRDGLENPVPSPEAGAHGGSSGYLFVKAGESVSFECEYFNPTTVEAGLGETTKDEMCNIFGMYYPTDGGVWSCACLGTGCFARN